MRPAFERPHRYTADLSRILIGHALSPNQDQRLPMLGGKFCERGAKVLEVALRVLLWGCPKASRIGAVRVFDLAACLAMTGVEEVAQDCEQPCVEVRARLEAVDVGPRSQDGVLHEVVGIIRVAGQRDRKRPQAGDGGQHGFADLRGRRHWILLRGARPKRSTRSIRRSGMGSQRSWPYRARRSRPILSWS